MIFARFSRSASAWQAIARFMLSGSLTATDSTGSADHSIDDDEIAAFTSGVSDPDATEANIRRVSARLAAAGWALAGVSHPAL
jgi:Protein of unknown function (DUF3349)